MIDAQYEKSRIGDTVRDVAVLVALGIDPVGQCRGLGISVAPSKAAAHWQSFLEHLVASGLHGVELITSDSHVGAQGAIRVVYPAATWKRCQFHLIRNAQRRAPNRAVRVDIYRARRGIWDCPTLPATRHALATLVTQYRVTAPALAAWLAANVSESLGVLTQPAAHRVHLRTTNLPERAV